jgi:hypothetical protein
MLFLPSGFLYIVMKYLKKIQYWLFFYTVMCCLSCTKIAMLAYGIKDPRVENEQSTGAYLANKGLDSTRNLVLKSIGDYQKISREFTVGVPEAIFFNRQGYFIDYHSRPDCNANVDSFIMKLDTSSFLLLPKGELNASDLLFSTNSNANMSSIPDYYVFFVWAKYADKIVAQRLISWVACINLNPNVKIEYYFLNVDFQEKWGMPLGKKVKKR